MRTVADSRFPLAVFALCTVLVLVDTHLSITWFPPEHVERPWGGGLFSPFARYDSDWYLLIATEGYFYDGPGRQSAVNFFPAYPAAIRVVALAVGSSVAAGVLVTVASGAGVAVVFFRWCRAAFDDRTARIATGLLLLYPFAHYLYGPVYSEALFLLAVVGAFALLEHEHPVLAGILGAAATAARPVGVALVVGLVVRELEIRGVLGPSRPAFGRRRADGDASPSVPLLPRRIELRALRPSSAAVLISVGGIAAYVAYLGWRFGEPLAFQKVASTAPGWARHIDLRTALHVHHFELLASYGLNVITFWTTLQGLFALVALGSTVAVARHLGRGYAVYVLVVVGLPFVSQPQLSGMGRYALASFPTFAVIAHLLTRTRDRRRGLVLSAVLGTNAVLLVWAASLYARDVFLG